MDIERKLAELRADDGVELTSGDGEVDWVVVERVLAGHPVKMTWSEWDAVAGRVVALRLEHHGMKAPRPLIDEWSFEALNDPYREAVSRLAAAFGESTDETFSRLNRWWETHRRRDLREEKKRRDEEMKRCTH